MYPYDFESKLKGLNPEEIFVVMPFAPEYDQVFSDLIVPAVEQAADRLDQPLNAYRTKGDPRTTSGWIEVLEHLNPAQVVLGVLTERVNLNVHYELGIAHATQPIQRQVLIAEDDYVPGFDTKDLIFMRYDSAKPADSVDELTVRIVTALTEWIVDQERMVRHAIAKVGPYEFEIVMLWAQHGNFALNTSGSGPSNYEAQVAQAHGHDDRYMTDVFSRHCMAIGRLQEIGLLGLSTHSSDQSIEFSYYWTDLGNLVLLHFKRIDETERRRRFGGMPVHLRRVS